MIVFFPLLLPCSPRSQVTDIVVRFRTWMLSGIITHLGVLQRLIVEDSVRLKVLLCRLVKVGTQTCQSTVLPLVLKVLHRPAMLRDDAHARLCDAIATVVRTL